MEVLPQMILCYGDNIYLIRRHIPSKRTFQKGEGVMNH
jgi:hypothetical protein